ncbi:unnamed protein product [Ectocarpus sp. 13 AM-2016]
MDWSPLHPKGDERGVEGGECTQHMMSDTQWGAQHTQQARSKGCLARLLFLRAWFVYRDTERECDIIYICWLHSPPTHPSTPACAYRGAPVINEKSTWQRGYQKLSSTIPASPCSLRFRSFSFKSFQAPHPPSTEPNLRFIPTSST